MTKTEQIESNHRDMYHSDSRLLAILALCIFIAEAFIMALIHVLSPIPLFQEIFMDSLLLVFVLSPVLYSYFSLRKRMEKALLLERDKLKSALDVMKRNEEALRESERDLQYLSSKILAIQEEERMRISRELHDELGQALILLKLHISRVETKLSKEETALREECREIQQYIEQVIENVRRISRDLSPVILRDLGLNAGLQRMAAEFARHHPVKVSLDVGDVDPFLSEKARIMVYRIFQEALTNIGKHSGAASVCAVLKRENGSFRFMVEDNGVGFDPEQMMRAAGLGLATMRERVRMMGGSLDLRSGKGKGTRISFSCPISQELS